jgi:uncharacterized protein
MDKSEAVNLVKRYSDVVREHFDVDKVVLFGSYATGHQREYSDIDVAVVMPEPGGKFLDYASKLWRLTDGIDVRIEPVILDPRHDRSGFLEHVLKTGEVIYSREG